MGTRTRRDGRNVNTDSELTSIECSVPDAQSWVRLKPNSADADTEAQRGGGLPKVTRPMPWGPCCVNGLPAELEDSGVEPATKTSNPPKRGLSPGPGWQRFSRPKAQREPQGLEGKDEKPCSPLPMGASPDSTAPGGFKAILRCKRLQRPLSQAPVLI